jgi:hypothetical protein
MQEQPILFTGPMVRAIQLGEKTQTRRTIKPRYLEGIETDEDGRFSFMHSPACGGYCDYACAAAGEVLTGHIGWTPWGSNPRLWGNLWVRETTRVIGVSVTAAGIRIRVRYEADGVETDWLPYPKRLTGDPKVGKCLAYGCYREASRLLLEIISVRAERLQDITETDAIAEGVALITDPVCARDEYAILWDQINGKGAWDRNPWVWVVEFRRLEGE